MAVLIRKHICLFHLSSKKPLNKHSRNIVEEYFHSLFVKLVFAKASVHLRSFRSNPKLMRTFKYWNPCLPPSSGIKHHPQSGHHRHHRRTQTMIRLTPQYQPTPPEIVLPLLLNLFTRDTTTENHFHSKTIPLQIRQLRVSLRDPPKTSRPRPQRMKSNFRNWKRSSSDGNENGRQLTRYLLTDFNTLKIISSELMQWKINWKMSRKK